MRRLQPSALVFEMLTVEQARPRHSRQSSRSRRTRKRAGLGGVGFGRISACTIRSSLLRPEARIPWPPRSRARVLSTPWPTGRRRRWTPAMWPDLVSTGRCPRPNRPPGRRVRQKPIATLCPTLRCPAWFWRKGLRGRTNWPGRLSPQSMHLAGRSLSSPATGMRKPRRGIPALLDRARPDLSVLSVGQLEADPGPEAPFDLWIVDRSGRPARSLRKRSHGQQGLRAMIVPNLAVADLPPCRGLLVRRAGVFGAVRGRTRCDHAGWAPRAGVFASLEKDGQQIMLQTAESLGAELPEGGAGSAPRGTALSAWLGPPIRVLGRLPAGHLVKPPFRQWYGMREALYPRPGWAYPVPGRRGWPGAGIAAWGVGQDFLENTEKTEFSRKLWRERPASALAGAIRGAWENGRSTALDTRRFRPIEPYRVALSVHSPGNAG